MQHEQAAGDPDSSREGELSVVFVDLVRFTSLTDIHGDITAADAASALDEVTNAALGEGDRLVKSVGDGVLLVARSPAGGLRLAGAIIEGLHDLEVGLDARGGVHHGSVVRRDGEWLTDPVCGMRLRAGDAIAPLRETGEPIGFCSQRCAELFNADARAD